MCRYDIHLARRSASEYESVPADVWKFFTTHFRGGPAIPRFCSEDPCSGSVELETPIHVSVLQEGSSGAVRISAPPSLPYALFLSFSLKCLGLIETDDWILMDNSGDSETNVGGAAALGEAVTLMQIGIQVRHFHSICF